jgi:hypothetical protein
VAILTADTRIVGDSDATETVEGDGRYLACASGPMLVVPIVPRHGVVIIVVDVSTGVLILQKEAPRSVKCKECRNKRSRSIIGYLGYAELTKYIHQPTSWSS